MELFDILPGDLLFVFGVPLVVAAILILVAGRPDDDPASGTRTQARYLGTVGILSLFIALFALFGVVRGASDLIVDKGDRGGNKVETQIKDIVDQIPGLENLDLGDLDLGSLDLSVLGGGGHRTDPDDANYRLIVQSALLALAAGAVFVFHDRRSRRIFPRDDLSGGAVARVGRAYLYGAAFVGVIVFLVAASKGAYGLFRIIAPGVTAAGNDDIERQRGIAEFLSYGFLAVGGGVIFRGAWRWLPEQRTG